MKPNRWLVIAAALTSCAIAYGVHLLSRHGDGHAASVPPVKSKVASVSRERSSFKPVADGALSRRARAEQALREKEDAAMIVRKITGAPVTTEGRLLSEAQWRDQANKVEMETNHELNRLVGLLDLDPSQQNKIFSTLARQSPNWLPGMQTAVLRGTTPVSDGGSLASNSPRTTGSSKNRGGQNTGTTQTNGGTVDPGTTTTDVTAYLDADQQQSLVQEEMDRQAWWAEILPQLLPPTLDTSTPATAVTGSGTTTAEPPPETKAFDGGDVLLEE